MKTFIIIFILVLAVKNSYSQNGWQQLSSFTSTNLSHVYFVNSNTGIITAYSPVIYRSIDGGITWSQYLYSNTNVWFWGIDFINESTGWVIGYSLNSPYSNTILRTSNGGANWIEQYTGIGQIREVFFINTLTGFVSGDSFYKTTNAGTNWIVSNPPGYNTGLGLFFWDQNTGWVGGGSSSVNTIISTTNSGTSWYSQLPVNGHLYDIHFFNSQTGFAAGPNGIIKTTNSGINWLSSYNTTYGGALSFPNSQTGWATILVSNPTAGKLIKTTDGGSTWVIQSIADPRIFGRVFMLNLNTGWVVGDEGVIYKTTNGGATGIQPVNNEIPSEFSLSQNYPNPFNPDTRIRFDIPNTGKVIFSVYDILGTEIFTLNESNFSPGIYEYQFDGTDLPSGIYFYRLSSGNFTDTRKMVLIK